MANSITTRQVTRYYVKFEPRHGGVRYQSFASPETAAKKLAWWLIFDKYPEGDGGLFYHACTCIDETTNWFAPTWDRGCPVHAPDGTLRELHGRLVRYILLRWRREHETQAQ